MRVGSNIQGFSLEFWAGKLQQYYLEIISPSGEISIRVGQREDENEEIRFLFDRCCYNTDPICICNIV